MSSLSQLQLRNIISLEHFRIIQPHRFLPFVHLQLLLFDIMITNICTDRFVFNSVSASTDELYYERARSAKRVSTDIH